MDAVKDYYCEEMVRKQKFLGLPTVFICSLIMQFEEISISFETNINIIWDIKSFGAKICEHIYKCIHPSAATHQQSNVVPNSRGARTFVGVRHQACAQNSITFTAARCNQILSQQTF